MINARASTTLVVGQAGGVGGPGGGNGGKGGDECAGNGASLLNSGGAATLSFGSNTAVLTIAESTPANLSFAFLNPAAGTSGITTTDLVTNSTVVIGGDIDLNATAATGINRTFTIADSAADIDVEILGVISNSGGGPTGLIKAGAGSVLKLSGTAPNTFSGPLVKRLP